MRFFGLLYTLRVFTVCSLALRAHFLYYWRRVSAVYLPRFHLVTSTPPPKVIRTKCLYIFYINITTSVAFWCSSHVSSLATLRSLIVELKESFAITVIIPETITYCAHSQQSAAWAREKKVCARQHTTNEDRSQTLVIMMENGLSIQQ